MSRLQRLAPAIDRLNDRIGRAIAWLALFMVLVQFVVVVMRYVFGVGSIVMQESIVYMHSLVFLAAAGYTLLHGGHVRVDIFYAGATPRRQALIDALGVLLLLAPMCFVIFITAWPYVAQSWSVLEISQEGDSGIPGVFLLKSVILVYAVLVSLQGLSLAARSLLRLGGAGPDGDRRPGGSGV